MRIWRSWLAFALLLVLAGQYPTRAAEKSLVIPEGLRGFVSVSSPNQFLTEVDKAIVEAIKGQQIRYAPGFLPMMAKMFNPLPDGSWNPDRPAFALIRENDPKFKYPSFILGMDDFDDTVKKLRRMKSAFRDGEDGRVWIKRQNDDKSMLLTDIGEGRVLATMNEQAADELVAVLENWRPEHVDDGCISVYLNASVVMEDAAAQFDKVANDIAALDEDEFLQKLQSDPDLHDEARTALLGGVRLIKEYYPRLEAEMRNVRVFGISLKFSEDRVNMLYSFFPEEGSFMSEVNNHLAKRGVQDLSLAESAGKDAAFVLTHCPPRDYFPEAAEMGRGMLQRIMAEIMPGSADTALDLYDRAAAAGVNESVLAGYLLGGIDLQLAAFIGSDKPRELLDVAIESALNCGDALGRIIRRKGLTAAVSAIPGSEDGVEYVRFGIQSKRTGDGGESATAGKPTWAQDFDRASDLLVSASDRCLVLTGEPDGVDWLLEMADKMSGQDDAGLLNGEEVDKALSSLTYNQAYLLFIDVGKCAVGIIDYARDKGELSREAAAEQRKLFAKSNEFVVVGGGADADRIVTEFSVPLKTINRIVASTKTHEAYK